MIKIISKDVDELKDIMTQKDCKKLKELIISNPDAPLLIFVGVKRGVETSAMKVLPLEIR